MCVVLPSCLFSLSHCCGVAWTPKNSFEDVFTHCLTVPPSLFHALAPRGLIHQHLQRWLPSHPSTISQTKTTLSRWMASMICIPTSRRSLSTWLERSQASALRISDQNQMPDNSNICARAHSSYGKHANLLSLSPRLACTCMHICTHARSSDVRLGNQRARTLTRPLSAWTSGWIG